MSTKSWLQWKVVVCSLLACFMVVEASVFCKTSLSQDGREESIIIDSFEDGSFEAFDFVSGAYLVGHATSYDGIHSGVILSDSDFTEYFFDELSGEFLWVAHSASNGLVMRSNAGIGAVIKKIIDILIKGGKKTPPKPPVKPPVKPPKKDPPKDVDKWEDEVRRERAKKGKDYPPDQQPPRRPDIPDHKGPPVPEDPFNEFPK